MKRDFVETKGFSGDWKALGQTDDEMRALQNYLAEYPSSGPMIEGAGGARKLRWGKEGQNSGKSSGVRVIYWDDPKDGTLYLLAVFGKNEKTNLSEAEKKAMKAFIKNL